MHTYKELYQMVETAIGSMDASGEPRELYDPVGYMMSLGGKRLRPVLVLMAAECCGGKPEDALPAALAVEIFHNFTLVHDDIMDQADIRRGKPTVHKQWNQTIAILSGDLMMIKASDSLCASPAGDLRSMLQLFNQTAIEVCEGQQLDMNFETRQGVTVADYLHMIALKTAVLLGCSLKLGAMTAGASLVDADHLYAFGKHIGIAFQIQDDLLDSFGKGEQTGKRVGGDIVANKKTFLLIHALHATDQATRSEIEAWLARNDQDEMKIKAMLQLFEKLNVQQYAETLKKEHLNKAFAHLDQVTLPAEKKFILLQTANELMERMN